MNLLQACLATARSSIPARPLCHHNNKRAELRRTRLQRVREAGMQGRLWLPATSTHYDHGAQPISRAFDFFPEGGKPEGLENPHGTADNQCTTQFTYGPGRESNR